MSSAGIHRFSFRRSLKYHFLEKKLNTVPGFLLFAVMATVIGYGTGLVDIKFGFIVDAMVASVLLVVTLVKYPYFGFYFLLGFSILTAVFDRLLNLPIPTGTFVDVITFVLFLTILLNYDLKSKIDGRFWTNPITVGLYVQFSYYIIELFNRDMFSKLGWFSFFRKQLSYLIIYYIAYCILNSRERIIYFIRFMIVSTTLCALYACKQQWFGYSQFELNSINPTAFLLLNQGGLFRKFSVFADPATSGILFASIAMLSLILMIRSPQKKEKRWLAVAVLINLLGYSYSGTRTATLMIVAGIGFYCLVTPYEKRTLRFLGVSLATFIALMVLPFNNIVTNRIRSTFQGSKDASAAVRDYDRHQVQPYIQDHMMGGGIFTSGAEGPKYNPGHYLEPLQPDSGYMKVLAEQGPLGLLIMLTFYFIVMQHGFRYFYRVRDPELQSYYIGLLMMMFTWLVAQYAQISLAQYPIALFFYISLVIFIKLADYDTIPEPKNNQI
jgi:putative inorganic carbon (hco3(-)) transporter